MIFKNGFYLKFRNNRLLHLLVVNLRYLIGLGFLPSGMIKVLNKPFTRVENTGIFVDYLDALYTTGLYYNMIRVVQVVAAILLITQRYATLGAALFLPVIFNIAALTLSTIGSLTPLVTTLMLLGIIFLLLWDYYKWINVFSRDNFLTSIPTNNFLTANKIHVRTGICMILLPSLLVGLELPKTALVVLGLTILGGNIISEWRHPVLLPFFRSLVRRSTSTTDLQKL